MNLWIYLALVGVSTMFEETQAEQLCNTQPKNYSRSIQVPTKVCRQVDSVGVKTQLDQGGQQSTPRVVSTPLRGDSFTANQIIKVFPGLFFNQTEANKLNEKMKKISGIKPSKGILPEGAGFRPSPQNDGDLHCPTYRNLEAAPENLRNIRQETKEIVHFSSVGIYQYFHKGTCGSGSTQRCSDGGCHQQKSIVYLMVMEDDPDWPYGFDPFEVESYCSCIGIVS